MKKINLHYKDKSIVVITFDQVTIDQSKMILERHGLIQDNFDNISKSFTENDQLIIDKIFSDSRELIFKSFLLKDINFYSNFYSNLSTNIQGDLEKVLKMKRIS